MTELTLVSWNIVERLAAWERRPNIIAGDYNEWRDHQGLETMPG